jgi:hypothetical protein
MDVDPPQPQDDVVMVDADNPPPPQHVQDFNEIIQRFPRILLTKFAILQDVELTRVSHLLMSQEENDIDALLKVTNEHGYIIYSYTVDKEKRSTLKQILNRLFTCQYQYRHEANNVKYIVYTTP